MGIQFIPTKINKGVVKKTDDFIYLYNVPDKIANRIKTSCYDCHSNSTNYPWYSKIQPINMLINQHIEEGKEDLNLSEFGKYSDRRKKSKLKSMINQIENDEMPLTSYKLLHWNSTFSEKEKKEVLDILSEILVE